MKLAEALQERADILTNIEQLKRRLMNNVLVQEGEVPTEDPADLKKELDGSLARLTKLVFAINKTNCLTLSDGASLTQLIAERDSLSDKISAYRDIAYTASQTARRASHTEIKILATIDVKKWQSEIDVMSKELRLLNNRLQQCNWNTDLIED